MTANDIGEILAGTVGISSKVQKIILKAKNLEQYFTPEQTAEEIETEIFEALAFFRANKQKNTN